MPRPLILSVDGREFPVQIIKINREDLYGSVEIEAFDEKGKPAELLILAPDGKTLIGKGGTALATLDAKGNSISRTELNVVGPKGEELERVKSSFDHPNELRKADLDDYLSMIVKSVYSIDGVEDESIDHLTDLLSDGRIYRFPFSYRGGVEYDDAFVIGNGKDAFLVIGKQAVMQFAKLGQAAQLDPIEEEEVSADDLDFDLL
jgi:hypothetical protein